MSPTRIISTHLNIFVSHFQIQYNLYLLISKVLQISPEAIKKGPNKNDLINLLNVTNLTIFSTNKIIRQNIGGIWLMKIKHKNLLPRCERS